MVDLNSDLGEGFGVWSMADDDALLDIVTSANIACGFHAGDPSIMRRTCDRAVERGVRIGAHIGHRDLIGFGRRTIEIEPAQLRDESIYQIGALNAFAHAAGDRVRYVKPHGALYHSAGADAELADAVVSAMRAVDPGLVLLGPPNSELTTAAERGDVRFVAEGFADRAYTPAATLAPRSTTGAVLAPEAALAQALSIAEHGRAPVVGGGSEVSVDAGSICVHGDSPGALDMAWAVRRALSEAGLDVAAFA